MVWRWPCRPLRVLLLALLASACVRSTLPVADRASLAQVDVIAVGKADAILVSSAAGKHVLIDGGEAQTADTVLAALRARSACPLDLILLTHPHSDHAGGLARVVEDCGARRFMDSGYPHASQPYARLLATLERRRVPVLRAEAGREIELGPGTTLTLLGPPQPFLDGGPDPVNGNSVVSRLVAGRVSVLFTGDANVTQETWLLGRGSPLRSDVVKVGHHGSKTSSTAEFLAAVRPRLAIITSRADDPKHPHPDALARLQAVNAQVLETGRAGTVHLELDGAAVIWSSENHPQKVRLP